MIATDHNLITLGITIKRWGRELDFADIRISEVDLAQQEAGFLARLELGYHGEMDYMAMHPTCGTGNRNDPVDYDAHGLFAA